MTADSRHRSGRGGEATPAMLTTDFASLSLSMRPSRLPWADLPSAADPATTSQGQGLPQGQEQGHGERFRNGRGNNFLSRTRPRGQGKGQRQGQGQRQGPFPPSLGFMIPRMALHYSCGNVVLGEDATASLPTFVSRSIRGRDALPLPRAGMWIVHPSRILSLIPSSAGTVSGASPSPLDKQLESQSLLQNFSPFPCPYPLTRGSPPLGGVAQRGGAQSVRCESRRERPSLAMRVARTEVDSGPIYLLPLSTRKVPAASALVDMTANIEPQRRSHLRRLLNAIIRRRNRVAPSTEIKGIETPLDRFDANSLHGGAGQQHIEADVLPLENTLAEGKARKKVLILMSDTGGGHRASAEALKATFETEFGDKYEVAIVDVWKDHTPFPFNQMPKSYSFLVKHESLWRMAFYATKPRFVHQPQMAATSAFVARSVGKMLDLHRPDILVSVHPLMQHIPLRVLRSRGLLLRIPFTTVITDLTTCHPTWFHKLATMCFCPTKEVAQRALKAGLTPSQLRVHGLPVRPAFSRPPSKPQAELRKDLGMHPELPAVLLIGGGEGMGPVEATARALAVALGPASHRGGPTGQLIIVCGRNKKLQEKLAAVPWPMPVQICGFVTNMPDVMAACNCIITKAGPGTIAESLIRGLPLILNDFIAGQEVGNVPYVVENGAGFFCEDPKKIAKIVADWFGVSAAQFAQMAENARRLARPDAVFRIVRDLDHLACGEKLVDQRELALL